MSKPAFDPSAPFQPADKPAFDPNAPFDPVQAMDESPPAPVGPSMAESAVRGGAKGITFGFADEAAAAIKAAAAVTAAQLGARGDISFSDAYDTNLNAFRKRDAEAQKENPWTFGGAELAGGIISPAAKALAPLEGASAVNVIGRGAAAGALTGAGESTAKPFQSPDEAEKFAGDVGIGGALGGALSGATKLAGSAWDKFAPDSLKQFARERLVKAATGQNQKAIRNMAATGAADESGSALDAAGRIIGQADEAGPPIVGWLSKAEEILPRAQEKRDFFGKKIGDVATGIDEAMPNAVDSKRISQRVLDYASSIPETEQTKPVIDKLLREAQRLEGRGSMSFADAQDLKGTFKFKPMDSSTHTYGQEGSNELNSIFRTEMDNTANHISQVAPDDSELKALAAQYRDLKAKYQAYRNISEAGEKRAAANVSNRMVSPSDYGSMGLAVMGSLAHGAGAAQTALLAAGAGAANKFARQRGSAFAGTAANRLAGAMEAAPESVGTAAGAVGQYLNSGMGGTAAMHQVVDKTPEQLVDERRQRLRQIMQKRLLDLHDQGFGSLPQQQMTP